MKHKALKIFSISIVLSSLFLASCSSAEYSKRSPDEQTEEEQKIEVDYQRFLNPTGLSYESENNKISWDKVSGAFSYDINIDGEVVATLDNPKTLEYIPSKNLDDGKIHLISVRGLSEDKSIKSNYSSIVFDPTTATSIQPYQFSLIEGNDISVDGFNSSAQYDDTITIPSKILGYNVTKIGNGAFKNNSSLKKITLPNTITKIEDEAFYRCTNLSTINMPTGLVEIGENAFYKTAITSVSFSTSLTKIGNNAFDGATKLSKVTFASGSNLSHIGDYAFKSNSSLSGFTIPDNVSYLGVGAFSESQLKTLTFPAAPLFDALPDYLLSKCRQMLKFDIPSFVKKLGVGLFSGCTSLKTVTLPEDSSIDTLPDECFYSCSNLLFFGYEKDNPNSKDKTVILPTTIKRLGAQCFAKTAIIDYELENGNIEYAGESCFSGNTKLVSIKLPTTLKYLGDSALFGCSALTTIDDSGVSLDYLGGKCFNQSKFQQSNNGKRIIIADCFYQASSEDLQASSIVFDNNIKCVCSSAFMVTGGKTSGATLTQVTFGNNLKSIGDSAFYGQAKLTNITFPSSLEHIYNNAFADCTSIKSLNFGDLNNSHLIEIGSEAFSGLVSLETLSLPSSVTTIGEKAFFNKSTYNTSKGTATGDSSLTDISISSDALLENIGNEAFAGNINVTHISLPNNVKYIGNGAFKNTTSLSNFEYQPTDESLTYLGDEAFSGSNISDIKLPKSLQYLGKKAFIYCKNLSDISFDINSLVSQDTLYASTFEGCSSLEEITIPDAILNMEDNVFKNAKKLLIINTKAKDFSQNTFENTAFEDSFGDGMLIFNNVLISYSGKEANITIANNIESINKNALKGNKYVKSITFGTSLKKIEANAFDGCSNLTTVDASNSTNLVEIENEAFQNCNNLTSVSLPNNLEILGDKVFYNCYKLENLVFDCPKVEVIGDRTFENCNKLSNITLPTNLKHVGDYAFYQTSIASIEVPAKVETIGNYAFANIGVAKDTTTSPKTWQITPTLAKIDFTKALAIHSIGNYAFSNNIIVELIFDESVNLTLGEYSFENSTKIENIKLADNIITSQGVFAKATNVKSIELSSDFSILSLFGGRLSDIPQSLEKIVITEGSTTISDNMFNGFGMVKEIDLPDTITSVGKNAFYGCRGITSINLKNVTNIGDGAFYGSTSLSDINFGSKLEYIGEKAFDATKYLLSKDDKFVAIDGILISYNGDEKEVTLGDDIVAVAGGAFAGNHTVETLNLSKNVTLLCKGAFDSCTNLANINITASTLCNIELEIFDTLPVSLKIKVPNSLLSSYKKDIYWSLYDDNLIGV